MHGLRFCSLKFVVDMSWFLCFPMACGSGWLKTMFRNSLSVPSKVSWCFKIEPTKRSETSSSANLSHTPWVNSKTKTYSDQDERKLSDIFLEFVFFFFSGFTELWTPRLTDSLVPCDNSCASYSGGARFGVRDSDCTYRRFSSRSRSVHGHQTKSQAFPSISCLISD